MIGRLWGFGCIVLAAALVAGEPAAALTFAGERHGDLPLGTVLCDNDNSMGRGVVAPEPGSMLLLGTGLIGAARIWRRKRPES